jgi:hypothetical protein
MRDEVGQSSKLQANDREHGEAVAQRDALLREAAARFCAGMTDHQASALLHVKLLRYQTSAWRRDRAEAECPLRLAGRLDAVLWQILKTHDHVCSAMTIRRALGFS